MRTARFWRRAPALTAWRRAWALAGAPAVVLGLPAFLGCLSPDDPLDAATLAAIQETDCADVSATYESFAAAYIARYCLRCHSESLVGDVARLDAPVGIDFDTLEDARSFASRIRLRAGELGDMPPRLLTADLPSHDERVQLMLWIDCGTRSEAADE
jgi:uncharacterized membrane protein